MLTLPPQVIFLFAIVGVQVFGANDPAHFGSTVRAMLSLFVCATLSAWSEVYSINFFGCDVYDAGAYFDADDAAAGRIVTDFGSFDGYACAAPNNGLQVVTVVYFVSYTILAGFVILSLFISVITMAMFEIIQMKDQEKAEELVAHEVPSDERRARMRALISNPASGTSAAIMSAVLPKSSRISTHCGCRRTSTFVTSAFAPYAAFMRGVQPSSASARLASAPWSSNKGTTAAWPHSDATPRAVSPLRSFASTSTPRSKSSRAHSALPWDAAQSSAV